MSDVSPESRAAEIRAALDRLRQDLDVAGVDLADPRARQLVIAALGGAGGDRKLSAASKAALALELKAGGSDYDEIARQVGYANRGSAWRAVQRALAAVRDSLVDTEEVRGLELMRLDQLQAGSWTAAKKGDAKAVRNVLAVMDRRRHLVPGLDVLGEDAASIGGSTINVIVAIPQPQRTAPIPQGELGELLEVHAREVEARRVALEADDPDEDL